jgi:hypothetical protein
VKEATTRFTDSYLELQQRRTELGDRRTAEGAAAAGRPGRYTVTVDAESPAGSATGSADFEIVG